MSNNNVYQLKQPEEITTEALTELIRTGAKALISQVVNADLEELLAHCCEHKVDGKQAVIRNGYLPTQSVTH